MLCSFRNVYNCFCPLCPACQLKHAAPIGVRTDRLIELLMETFGCELGDTYATNLFPFVEKEAASTHITMRDLVRAATESVTTDSDCRAEAGDLPRTPPSPRCDVRVSWMRRSDCRCDCQSRSRWERRYLVPGPPLNASDSE